MASVMTSALAAAYSGSRGASVISVNTTVEPLGSAPCAPEWSRDSSFCDLVVMVVLHLTANVLNKRVEGCHAVLHATARTGQGHHEGAVNYARHAA